MIAKPQIAKSSAGAAPAITVENLSFTYHGSDEPALRGISFIQSAGEMIGIVGASGVGKSTLAKCLNRIIPEFEGGRFAGRVIIGNRSFEDLAVHDVAGAVGMVFQDFEAQLFSTNVAHEVAFAMEQAGMSRAEMVRRIGPALQAVGLAGFEHRDPTTLSGGEKQRLAIAAVLALEPGVIVMDEPTTDLDPEGRAEVFALIQHLRAQGLTLVVIEHETGELRGCDRILLMREGAIAADAPPGELFTRIDLLEESGVRPPDLNRVLAGLGISQPADDVDQAEVLIRCTFPNLPHPLASAIDAPSDSMKLSAETPLVELNDLTFSYAADRRALDAVSLKVMPGEFVAVIGQNGSGKTTLAKHIIGLLTPERGRVMLDGRDRSQLRPAESAHLVGYVFQNPDHQIFAATVEDEVKFGPRNFGLPADEIEHRCAEVLRAVNLEHERAADPFLLGKGQRQRLAVASVLALRPRLLILDEPTTGLDYREQRRMMTLVSDLNRAGIAIVMITHTPSLVAEYARRVILMRSGRIIFDGPVGGFFAQHELLRTSSFRAPEVIELAARLGTIAATPEKLAAWIRDHR
ncbi:MAG: energy-coupling factor ABC transporter ATP-binding protein [Candidatus Binataceae bacterium]|nr:energy-coupling factor ABC transporter ATP-binding protein [Candidatus Binataceae bacterium]